MDNRNLLNIGGFIDLKRYLDKIYFDKPISYQSNIFGIILLVIGIVFFYNPTPLTIKLGVTSILIGFFMIFMITGKKRTKGFGDVQITLAITGWIIVMFLITAVARNASVDIFLILSFLGALTIVELTDEFTSAHLKKRMNVFIFLFLIVFAVIVAKKIINLSII